MGAAPLAPGPSVPPPLGVLASEPIPPEGGDYLASVAGGLVIRMGYAPTPPSTTTELCQRCPGAHPHDLAFATPRSNRSIG